MLRLFAGVQKLLQVGVLLLLSHRTCLSLFMQVSVNGVSFDVDLYLYPPPYIVCRLPRISESKPGLQPGATA